MERHLGADGVADDVHRASVGEEALRGGEVRLDVVQLSREGKPTADAEIVGGMSKVAEDFDVGVAVELAVEFAREGLVEGGDAGIAGDDEDVFGRLVEGGEGEGEVSGGEDARAPRISPQRGAPRPTTTTRAQMCVGRTSDAVDSTALSRIVSNGTFASSAVRRTTVVGSRYTLDAGAEAAARGDEAAASRADRRRGVDDMDAARKARGTARILLWPTRHRSCGRKAPSLTRSRSARKPS